MAEVRAHFDTGAFDGMVERRADGWMMSLSGDLDLAGPGRLREECKSSDRPGPII